MTDKPRDDWRDHPLLGSTEKLGVAQRPESSEPTDDPTRIPNWEIIALTLGLLLAFAGAILSFLDDTGGWITAPFTVSGVLLVFAAIVNQNLRYRRWLKTRR